MHADWVSVEHGGVVFPLTQGVRRRLLQKDRAGKEFHGGNPTICIDKGVNLYIARNMLRFCQPAVDGLDRREQLCGSDIASYRQRSCRTYWLAGRTAEIRAHRRR